MRQPIEIETSDAIASHSATLTPKEIAPRQALRIYSKTNRFNCSRTTAIIILLTGANAENAAIDHYAKCVPRLCPQSKVGITTPKGYLLHIIEVGPDERKQLSKPFCFVLDSCFALSQRIEELVQLITITNVV